MLSLCTSVKEAMMSDILKAFALTCGVLLLASLAYVVIVFGLAYISGVNPDLMPNSPERIHLQMAAA